MTLREWLLTIGAFDLVFGVATYGYVVWRFRWIVPRFEHGPELLHHPLFFPYTPRGLRTVGYVASITSLDLIPEWLIRRGVERGSFPSSTSKLSARHHFTADELRRIRWAGRAILAWMAVLMSVALALAEVQ